MKNLLKPLAIVLTLFKMGIFRAAHDGREVGGGGKKHPYLRSVTYILQ